MFCTLSRYLPLSRQLIYAKCNVLLSLHRYSEVLGILAKLKGKALLPGDSNAAASSNSKEGAASTSNANYSSSAYASTHQVGLDSSLQWLQALAYSGKGDLDRAIRLGEKCCNVDSCTVHDVCIVQRVERWKQMVDLKREANVAFAHGQNTKSQELCVLFHHFPLSLSLPFFDERSYKIRKNAKEGAKRWKNAVKLTSFVCARARVCVWFEQVH